MDLKIRCLEASIDEHLIDKATGDAYVEVDLRSISEEHLVVALGEVLSEETVAILCDEPAKQSLSEQIKALRSQFNA